MAVFWSKMDLNQKQGHKPGFETADFRFTLIRPAFTQEMNDSKNSSFY